MAGGIDWFRWHHGSVTDPKFQLVAKKAGVRLGDVIVVWAFVLEKASADVDRGTIGEIDFETLDFLLGAGEGTAIRILDAMTARGLIAGSRIARWDERQPKREDESANERKRRQREREHAERMAELVTSSESRDVTQGHADVTQSHAEVTAGHARGEKRREEKKRDTPLPPKGDDGLFEDFWQAYPKKVGKDAARKAFDRRRVTRSVLVVMLGALTAQRASPQWLRDGGQFIPHPATWINEGRWQDEAPAPAWQSSGVAL